RWRYNGNGTHRSRNKKCQQRMSLKSLPLQKLTPKKSNTTNPKYSPLNLANTAIGTRWVMPQNLGTAAEVLFSNDPAHGNPAASRRLSGERQATESIGRD